jgi:hypothetical protein
MQLLSTMSRENRVREGAELLAGWPHPFAVFNGQVLKTLVLYPRSSASINPKIRPLVLP